MSANDDIANRHLLAADGLASTLQSEEQFVRIVVSERWSSSRAGQLLTACLVNLLCRQVKIVRHIDIVALPARALIRLPSGDAAESFPAYHGSQLGRSMALSRCRRRGPASRRATRFSSAIRWGSETT